MDHTFQFMDVQFGTIMTRDTSKSTWNPNSSSNLGILILGHSSFLCASYEVSGAPYLMGGPASPHQEKFYRRTPNQTNNQTRIYAMVN